MFGRILVYLAAVSIIAGTAACTVPESRPAATRGLPSRLAGMSLAELREDYRHRLFDLYLPFWHNGGWDSAEGGFICHLEDDGTPVDDEKNIWYQGRALWVYSFLYNNFGGDRKYLETARKTYGFMRGNMYAGEGRWYEIVGEGGRIIEGEGASVFGSLFAANGLAELYRATGDEEILDLALETLRSALARYDSPDYGGVFLPGELSSLRGIRTQGHSMVILRILTQLLSHHSDPELEALAARQVDLIMNRFYNPRYGIVNEYLDHGYRRIPGYEGHMFTGHSVETSWMLMHEALRLGDRELFDEAARRFHRFVEMSWDHVYGGLGSGDFFVRGGEGRVQGTDYSVKTMWLQCEAMVGCMTALEYTGEPWAADWYERVRAFTLRTVAANGIGVWSQAVDRENDPVQRRSYHPKRRGNFHQPRYMMLDMLSLDRMTGNGGALTPFPSTDP